MNVTPFPTPPQGWGSMTVTRTKPHAQPRRPAGAPASQGGQFAAPRSSGHAGKLELDPVTRGAELEQAHRDLWKRLDAKHRANIYARAAEVSANSDDPAELAILSHYAFGTVARNVATNPHTPAEVLHTLVLGESDHRPLEVRQLALEHPNCDPATRELHRRAHLPGFEDAA